MCRETLKGEARAGNTRGERGKEVCIRASDARCAGMPNLGSIRFVLEDFLPQRCAASSRKWHQQDDIGKIADLQGTKGSLVPMYGREPYLKFTS